MNTGGKALIVNGITQMNGSLNLVGDMTISGTLNATLNETDPVWNAEKSGYYTKTEIEAKSYLTGEKEALFMAASGNYYLKTNPNGYITGEKDLAALAKIGTLTAGKRCTSD